MFRIAIILAACFASIAHADTVFTDTLGSDKLTATEASKIKDGFVKCESVRIGPNINPVKVSGTPAYWFKTLPKGSDDPSALLSSGKKTYRCSDVYLDAGTGRVKKSH